MRPLALAAIDLYESTYTQGWWYRLWAALRRRPGRLLDLKTVAASSTIRTQRFAGIQIVPIRQIKGSEGRADDFDAAFHPIQAHTEVRWRGIARAWLADASMPPVDLIRVGDIYFVRDGHHRISVAKALGQQEIEAIVTVWQVEQPAPVKQPARPAHRPAAAPASACGPALEPARPRVLHSCDC
jgi:hypothetical protein